MFAGAAIGEFIDDGAHVRELCGGIGPYVRALRFAFTGNEHLHRRFVGVQHILLKKYFVKRVDQWLQPYAANPDPLAKR